MSRFAIVPYWRVLQQQQQTDSAFRYPGSGWMEELFGGGCLRFEKGGQRRGHSPCGPKTLRVHPTPTCPRCRPAAGALSRGGLVGSSGEDSCFGAGAGWGRQPCLRPTVHPVRGRVRRDGTKWTPLSNLQQATVNRTRGGSDSSPYYFPRNTCAVSVAEESTTARPGQDNEARMGTGHWARPPVPTAPLPPFPPVPRRGVPSIAQCVESWSRLRNTHEDRSSRSSLLHRETTLYQIYPDLRRALLPLPPAAAPRPPLEWRPGKHPSPACRTAKFALFMRQPARWRGWYGTRRPSPSGQFVRSTPPPAAAKRTAGERSGREAINTGSRPCDRLAAPR